MRNGYYINIFRDKTIFLKQNKIDTADKPDEVLIRRFIHFYIIQDTNSHHYHEEIGTSI